MLLSIGCTCHSRKPFVLITPNGCMRRGPHLAAPRTWVCSEDMIAAPLAHGVARPGLCTRSLAVCAYILAFITLVGIGISLPFALPDAMLGGKRSTDPALLPASVGAP